MGKLVRRVLKKRPHLHIYQKPESLILTFTFQGSVPRTLKKEDPRLYRALFKPKENVEKVSWVKVLLQAYSNPHSKGDKSVKVWLSFWFHKLFVDALSSLLGNAKDAGGRYEARVEEEIESLKKSLRRKPGRHKSHRRQERDAIRFAERHEDLIPQVTELKEFIKRHSSEDDKLLADAAQKALHYKWLSHVTKGQALQNLPMINNDPATAKSHLRGKWAPWQLSVGVIYCEEKMQNPRTKLGPTTIYKRILQGNRFLRKMKENASTGKTV